MALNNNETLDSLDDLQQGLVLYDQVNDDLVRINEFIEDGVVGVITTGESHGETREITEDNLVEFQFIWNAPTDVKIHFLSLRLTGLEQQVEEIAGLLSRALRG